jgi:hypothetical protein
MAGGFGQSGALAVLDCVNAGVGTLAYERCALDRLRSQSFEMENPMTPTEQAARWLADVPRFDLDPMPPIGTMDQEVSGEWMRYDDALAAIARHLAPGDDLVERAGKYPEILMGYGQGDMDGVMALISRQALHEAADTITALLARIAALTATVALRKGIESIRELNMTAEDENGHRWANSELIEQEIVAILALIPEPKP